MSTYIDQWGRPGGRPDGWPRRVRPAGAGPRARGTMGAMPAEELIALRDRCTRFLHGPGLIRAADLLAMIPPDTEMDRYGDGGAVASLEAEIGRLLGKPAAVFVPSGTMAQQVTLRVHAARRQRTTVVWHPMCHLVTHEGDAYARLQHLAARPAGEPARLLTLADLTAIAEPPAALLIELPQRDIGGQQPAWADLEAQAGWARERGAAVHLDGARLWESAAGYGRSEAEIAALFDTVYVSFYKGIGALAGCCVAGPEDVIAEVREWRQRMGGTLFGMWPAAASALTGLARRRPRMAAYLEHARQVAAALAGVPGVRVIPDPPQVPMMHLLLSVTEAGFLAAARRLAEQEGIWTWPQTAPTVDPGVQRIEFAVSEAATELSVAEIARVIAELAGAGQP